MLACAVLLLVVVLLGSGESCVQPDRINHTGGRMIGMIVQDGERITEHSARPCSAGLSAPATTASAANTRCFISHIQLHILTFLFYGKRQAAQCTFAAV
jgi:hypothetical protein